MNNQEALQTIDEISRILQSSNRALFSGRHLMLYGLVVLFVPIIGYLTQWLTFDHDFGRYHGVYIAVANSVFYMMLTKMLKSFVPRTEASKGEEHPLIRQAFSATRPILGAIIAAIFSLAAIGQPQFIYPVVLLLLGVMFSIYGRFTIPAISLFAWSFIAAGAVHLLLLPKEIPYLSFYFLAYNGLAYIVMGMLINRAERDHAE